LRTDKCSEVFTLQPSTVDMSVECVPLQVPSVKKVLLILANFGKRFQELQISPHEMASEPTAAVHNCALAKL
jgi:hypothetical protein